MRLYSFARVLLVGAFVGGTAALLACGSFTGSDVTPPSVDAGAAADAGRFCARIDATLCSDFDDPMPLSVPFGWDHATSPPPGLDDTISLSAPRSMRSSATIGSAGVARTFVIQSSISIELDARFEPILATPIYGAVKVYGTRNGKDFSDVLLFVNTTAPYFQSGTDAYSYRDGGRPLSSIQAGTWHHVAIKVTIGNAATTVTASVDGVAAWDGFPLPTSWSPGESVEVDLGVVPIYGAVDAGPMLTTWVDNVVVHAN